MLHMGGYEFSYMCVRVCPGLVCTARVIKGWDHRQAGGGISPSLAFSVMSPLRPGLLRCKIVNAIISAGSPQGSQPPGLLTGVHVFVEPPTITGQNFLDNYLLYMDLPQGKVRRKQ
jgi:hypothetical protein